MYKIGDADSSDILSHFNKGGLFDASSFEDFYDPLNDLTYVAPSVVIVELMVRAEKGLFASQDIEKGTYIGTYFGRVVQRNINKKFKGIKDFLGFIMPSGIDQFLNQTYVVWGEDATFEKGVDGKNNLRYSNHQDVFTANMLVRGFNFYARRDVAKGEELTWPYSATISNNLKRIRGRKLDEAKEIARSLK